MAAGIMAGLGIEIFKQVIGNGPALLNSISGIVGQHVEDPNKKAMLSLELQKLVTEREIAAANTAADVAKQQLAAATELNRIDAEKGRDWRSFIGWTLAGGVLYALLIQPLGTWLMTFVSAWFDINFPPPPELNWGQITALLATLLTGAGLSVATKVVGPK